MTRYHRVVIETGTKKCFASAIDWPGWSRSAKTEAAALETLAAYADRYKLVADLAGVQGVLATAQDFDIIVRLPGSVTTDFGAPGEAAPDEDSWMTPAECDRQIKLLRACWAYFDQVAARVSPQLQKGPRGGGRDRDKVVLHTWESECSYARSVGVKTPLAAMQRAEGLQEHRDAICAAIQELNTAEVQPKSWSLRYFIRRASWHVMDHAWEMEDKDLTGK